MFHIFEQEIMPSRAWDAVNAIFIWIGGRNLEIKICFGKKCDSFRIPKDSEPQ